MTGRPLSNESFINKMWRTVARAIGRKAKEGHKRIGRCPLFPISACLKGEEFFKMNQKTNKSIASGALAILGNIICLALTAHSLLAAPTDGTNIPYKGKYITGYQNNSIFKHDLATPYGNIESFQNYYTLSYGVFDWLTLDGKVGLGDLTERGGMVPKVEHNNGFAGGYGFRLRILDDAENKVRIVTGFQHTSTHPADRNLNGDKRHAIYEDWQFSLVASKDVGIITPFAGAKLSYGNLIQKTNDIDRKNRPPKYYAGAIIGCSVKLTKNTYLSVEGHFIDETSLSSGVYYTF